MTPSTLILATLGASLIGVLAIAAPRAMYRLLHVPADSPERSLHN